MGKGKGIPAFGFSRRILAPWAIKNSGHVHVNSIKQHITYKPDYNHHHQQHLRKGPLCPMEDPLPPRCCLACKAVAVTVGPLDAFRLPLTFHQPKYVAHPPRCPVFPLSLWPVTFFGCKTICNHKLRTIFGGRVNNSCRLSNLFRACSVQDMRIFT